MTVKLRKRKLANGNESLYLDIYQSGKRAYEFLGLYLTKDKTASKGTLELAKAIQAKRLVEIQNSEYGFVPHFKKKANFVDYFERIAQGKPRDDTAWKNTLKHLQTFSSGRIQFSAVTDDWLETFKTYLVTKVSQNTAHSYFSKIKGALRQAVKEKIILSNPGDLVSHIKRQDTERTFLKLAEIERLAQTPCRNHEVKRAFLFSCFTGLRLSDIRALLWQQIKEDTIEFRQKKTKGYEYLHLSEMARQILTDRPNPKVLNMQNTNIFNIRSKTQLGKVLKLWCKDDGINKRVTFNK